MGDSVLKDKKVCFACGSETTYCSPRGHRLHWQWNIHEGKRYCEKCNNRLFKNPKWHPITNRRKLKFKDRYFYAKTNLRTGICAYCNRTIKNGEIKRTSMHHIEYDASNPLAYTVELCNSCHRKEHIRINARTVEPS